MCTEKNKQTTKKIHCEKIEADKKENVLCANFYLNLVVQYGTEQRY